VAREPWTGHLLVANAAPSGIREPEVARDPEVAKPEAAPAGVREPEVAREPWTGHLLVANESRVKMHIMESRVTLGWSLGQ